MIPAIGVWEEVNMMPFVKKQEQYIQKHTPVRSGRKKMTEVPRITLPEKSNTESAKCWLEQWKQISYEPICRENGIRLRTILTELSKYVTVIGFNKDGELGTMNIDFTVQEYMKTVESIEQRIEMI